MVVMSWEWNGCGSMLWRRKGHFPLVISQVSEVDIEEEAVKGKKQNCACYIVSSANCNFYEGVVIKLIKDEVSDREKKISQFLFNFSKF